MTDKVLGEIQMTQLFISLIFGLLTQKVRVADYTNNKDYMYGGITQKVRVPFL